jgi:thiamine pyrophosphate-dependent acetolactate synthase large subunit-like protein
VQIDVDPAALGAHYPMTLGLVGDAAVAAARISDGLSSASEREKPFHAPAILARLSAHAPLDPPDQSTPEEIDPRALVERLDELLPANRTVVQDGGHFLGYPAIHLHVPGPGHFRLTADFASVGMGLGTALGVALGRPEAQTVLFIGDGGLAMTLGDLETVSRLRIPLLIIVMNDRAYGAERHLLDLWGMSHHQAQFPDIDFAAIARDLGIEGHSVRTIADLDLVAPALSIKRSTPQLLDCKILASMRAGWFEGH